MAGCCFAARNGAGKSKTLEMLLPFVLDGDAGSMDATGRRGSGLIWLMSEGLASGAASRLGYLWVEFARTDATGALHPLTCGVGLRLGASAKQVTKWYFTTTRRIDPADLRLSTDAGPLSARKVSKTRSATPVASFTDRELPRPCRQGPVRAPPRPLRRIAPAAVLVAATASGRGHRPEEDRPDVGLCATRAPG